MYSRKWYMLSALLFMLMTALIIMLFINIKELDIIVLVVLTIIPVILMGAFVYISTLELSIKIDKNRLSYRIVPLFNEWKYIIRQDIISFEVKNFDKMGRMTTPPKNNISWIGKHKHFIILGKHLLELQLAENRKVTLSTLHAEKINIAMQELINT